MNRIILSLMVTVSMITSQLVTNSNITMQNNTIVEGSLNIHAKAATLVDSNSKSVLYEKNANMPLSMASTTKIMTCILILENMSLYSTTSFSQYALSKPSVHLNPDKNDRFRIGDLLYSLMLESHNDTAVALAEACSGSELEFANAMNAKARELGLNDTFFITANGLDAQNDTNWHHTTAIELSKIMDYCINDSNKSKFFISICQTQNYTIKAVNTSNTYKVKGHNNLFNLYDNVICGKTGYTNKAGNCYVGAVEVNGYKIIIVLLASGWPDHKQYRWNDCLNLINYAKTCYIYIRPFCLEIPKSMIPYKRYKTKNDSSSEMEVIPIKKGSVIKCKVEYNKDKCYICFCSDDLIIRDIYLYEDLQKTVNRDYFTYIKQLIINISLL